MKKIITSLLAAVIAFSPLGTAVFQDHSTTVEARGKRSFNSTNNSVNSPSSFQNKKSDSIATNKSTSSAQKKGSFLSSGLMRGLMVGGLAGLLFGSLFGSMGMLGSILGLLVNVLTIVILLAVIRKIFTSFKSKKEKSVY
ncbi:hypothetical protein [Domibacillus indicus]|uniref:hypothetical protein n=1 Tax=Domibacillus indicus TaxID=1437523 RepID=UPI0006181B9C|nr:hypothetical protein [Domibacillus indicus]